MITKQLISSLFLLTILVVNIQQGVSLKCYECSSDDEKSDCWVKVDNLTQTECGGSNPTESPSTPTPVPTTQPPATQPPTTQPPATQPPATQPPATQPPATQPPATQPPATQPPATQPPATQPPATQPPATQPPATQPPVTQPPATQPPATQPPATQPPVTQPPATQPPATLSPQTRKILNDFEQYLLNQKPIDPVASRAKRDTPEWQCAKIITKNGEKKHLERKCVKKAEEICKDKANDSDNKCALCDKDLCNSASNIKLQLIPAFLSVFLALFLASQ